MIKLTYVTPALLLSFITLSGCASTQENETLTIEKPPLHGAGGTCWDGSWVEKADDCPAVPAPKIEPTQNKSPKDARIPTLAEGNSHPPGSDFVNCWDGTAAFYIPQRPPCPDDAILLSDIWDRTQICSINPPPLDK